MKTKDENSNILLNVAIKYVKRNILNIFLYIGFNFLLLFIGIINPKISGEYINALIDKTCDKTVYYYVKIFIILSFMNVVFYYLIRIIQKRLSINFKCIIEKKLISIIMGKQIGELQSNGASFLTQKMVQSTQIIIDFWIYLVNLGIKIIQTIIIVYLLYFISTKIFSVLAILIPIYVIIYLLLKRKIYKTNYKVQCFNTELFVELKQQIENVKTIRCLSIFSYFEKRLNDKYMHFSKAALANNRLSAIFLSLNLIVNKSATIIVFFFGGRQVIIGTLSLGYYTVLMSYFSSVMEGLTAFFAFANEYEKYIVAKKRIGEILSISNDVEGNIYINSVNNIQINKLTYEIDGKKVIDSLSYSFNKGYLYCIKGKNGAGKSTFIDIILGLVSDYSGDIFVEGHELRSICREHYRKKYVSVLFQSSLLFDGTIEENLFFDKKGREAKLYRLVETLGFGDIWGEKGMKYIINEKNSNLSGGERQKILLLRTLQKECDLLILDEPTSWLVY